MYQRPILYLAWLLLVLLFSSCSSAPQDLDATSTFVIANTLATRTAQASSQMGTSAPSGQIETNKTAATTPAQGLGRAASVLFFDDFSDPTSGWDEESDKDGGRSYSQGGYVIFVNKAEWCYWTTISRTYSDVVIEVDAQKISGSDNNEYGVIGRNNDNNDFYYFGIGSDGYYTMGKMVDEKWIELGQDAPVFNDKVINTGAATNHLKATAYYENLSFEVNGSMLMDITDSELRSGDVGLYVCTYEDKTEILFDNFKVSKP